MQHAVASWCEVYYVIGFSPRPAFFTIRVRATGVGPGPSRPQQPRVPLAVLPQ